jgi:hypothetical protein
MRQLNPLGLSSVLAVLLLGCAGGPTSSSDPGGGADAGSGSNLPPPGSLTPDMFIQQLVSKNCDKAFACMAQYPTTTGTTFADDWGDSQATCVSDDSDVQASAAIAASITNGNITWDATSAAACLADLQFPATCAEFFTTYSYPSACTDALSGNVADGAACTNDWDCAGTDTTDSTCVAAKCTLSP